MLVCDSTKLRRTAAVRIAHLSQIHTFVTDTALPPALQEICRSRGVKVIEALPGSADETEEALEPESTSKRAV
jgi:DeoR family glycerol-3-phosphate regulon repressor